MAALGVGVGFGRGGRVDRSVYGPVAALGGPAIVEPSALVRGRFESSRSLHMIRAPVWLEGRAAELRAGFDRDGYVSLEGFLDAGAKVAGGREVPLLQRPLQRPVQVSLELAHGAVEEEAARAVALPVASRPQWM